MKIVDISWKHPNQKDSEPNILNKYIYATNILKQIVFFEDTKLMGFVLEAFSEYDNSESTNDIQRQIYSKLESEWVYLIDKIVGYINQNYPNNINLNQLLSNG